MIAGHGAHQRHQVLADVFGDRFLLDLKGQVKAALGRIFVKGSLQEVQRLVDLALQLFLTELEDFGLFAHQYAYIYAYFKAAKSASQAQKIGRSAKKVGYELNCYPAT